MGGWIPVIHWPGGGKLPQHGCFQPRKCGLWPAAGSLLEAFVPDLQLWRRVGDKQKTVSVVQLTIHELKKTVIQHGRLIGASVSSQSPEWVHNEANDPGAFQFRFNTVSVTMILFLSSISNRETDPRILLNVLNSCLLVGTVTLLLASRYGLYGPVCLVLPHLQS